MLKIEDVCSRYEKQKFSIKELQGWFSTISLEDEFARQKGDILDEALNKLELIRFTQPEDEQYRLGLEITRQLADDIKEFDQTHKVRRYLGDANK